MKKFLLSLVGILVIGTTTSFGHNNNSPKVRNEKPRKEVVNHNVDKHVMECRDCKKVSKEMGNKRCKRHCNVNVTHVKRDQVTVSKQTIRF